MGAIAMTAIRRGHTFGTLAEALNKQDHTCLEASNIRIHFESKRPRDKTVESYARLLGVDVDDLRVLSGSAELREPKLSAELARLKFALLGHVDDFEVAAIEEARALVDRADAPVRARIGSQFFRASRQQTLSATDAVVAAFEGVLSLGMRRRIPNEDFLWGLWMEARTGLDGHGADAIIATAIGLLRLRGVDTTNIEERLNVHRATHYLALNETNGTGQR